MQPAMVALLDAHTTGLEQIQEMISIADWTRSDANAVAARMSCCRRWADYHRDGASSAYFVGSLTCVKTRVSPEAAAEASCLASAFCHRVLACRMFSHRHPPGNAATAVAKPRNSDGIKAFSGAIP